MCPGRVLLKNPKGSVEVGVVPWEPFTLVSFGLSDTASLRGLLESKPGTVGRLRGLRGQLLRVPGTAPLTLVKTDRSKGTRLRVGGTWSRIDVLPHRHHGGGDPRTLLMYSHQITSHV